MGRARQRDTELRLLVERAMNAAERRRRYRLALTVLTVAAVAAFVALGVLLLADG